MNQNRKQMRQSINDIALYSNGSYTVQDMYNMTQPQVSELLEAMNTKQDKEKEAMERAQGKSKTVY
jgi:hypothetical protein